MRNLKLALRTLFRTPFVTVVAVVSLALGIGATAAIFSLFNQMLLRPLPVRAPEQLVNLSAPGPKPGSNSCNQAGDCTEVFSYQMFRDLEKAQAVLTGLAAHRIFGANLAYKGQTLSGSGMLVSGSYFPMLGVQPALGRVLAPGDDRVVGESRVVVLSFNYWQKRFGLNPAVLNDALVVNGQSLTIVGVAPRGFDGTTLGSQPEVFVPDHASRADGTGLQGFRKSPLLLGVRLRTAETRRLHRASDGRHQRAVQGPHQRRRGASADGNERADDEAVQGAPAGRDARHARAKLGQR